MFPFLTFFISRKIRTRLALQIHVTGSTLHLITRSVAAVSVLLAVNFYSEKVVNPVWTFSLSSTQHRAVYQVSKYPSFYISSSSTSYSTKLDFQSVFYWDSISNLRSFRVNLRPSIEPPKSEYSFNRRIDAPQSTNLTVYRIELAGLIILMAYVSFSSRVASMNYYISLIS